MNRDTVDLQLKADRDALPTLLEAVWHHASSLLASLDERDVIPASSVPPPNPLPARGTGLVATLNEFAARWEPTLSASAGPRYLGFVTGGATPAALAGDWMTSAWDLNAFSSLDGPGQHLERETTVWLRSLFRLSERHHGTFVSGATMSNTVGLAIAREWLGERRGISPAEEGSGALGTVRVLSGAAHSSVSKGLSMLGLGRKALVPVAPLPGREAVDVAALERALQAYEADSPCVVVANAGTVNTADFDDLRAIGALRERYDFWLHVDAAFGAFARFCPDYSHLVDGLDQADSICIDLHKWLNVPYDSAVQFTHRRDLQAAVFQNSAAYIGRVGDTPDTAHLTPENSHRLRAIATWFTLHAYGRDGHREVVERCIACARSMGEAIDGMPELRLLAPVRLNVVCFTLAEDPTAARLAALAERLADEVFLTPTVLDGVPALRAAFSNWRTTEDDTRRIVAALQGVLGGA
ncbi:pyridoxal phosphate-dependent decarboxylase family protein [Streptomyces erythrochromogenes]|uniref:pyridoxal phosphate-dependent decarboxylase family protein n=1 Tax=Streptomyces erythrochromogenes TaxID=285574 RepID=UPI003682EC62